MPLVYSSVFGVIGCNRSAPIWKGINHVSKYLLLVQPRCFVWKFNSFVQMHSWPAWNWARLSCYQSTLTPTLCLIHRDQLTYVYNFRYLVSIFVLLLLIFCQHWQALISFAVLLLLLSQIHTFLYLEPKTSGFTLLPPFSRNFCLCSWFIPLYKRTA